MKENENAIVLLNDGEQTNQEGNCNSWPWVVTYGEVIYFPPECEW